MLEVSAISIVMATGILLFLATITFASDKKNRLSFAENC